MHFLVDFIHCVFESAFLMSTGGRRCRYRGQGTDRSKVPEYRRHTSDTGSPEVQIAQLSARVIQLTGHLQTHKKDFASRRGLLAALSTRKSLMQYLLKKDRHVLSSRPSSYATFPRELIWLQLYCLLCVVLQKTECTPWVCALLCTCQGGYSDVPNNWGFSLSVFTSTGLHMKGSYGS